MNEKMFLIPESKLKILINYLMSRPYCEVHQGVEELQKLEVNNSSIVRVKEESGRVPFASKNEANMSEK